MQCTMRLWAALGLLAAALQLQPEAAAAFHKQLISGAEVPSLILLFSANISAACAGRCSLQFTATRCDADGGAAADGLLIERSAVGSGELEASNSLRLPWEQSDLLDADLEVVCIDAACLAAPPSFVAWRGSACEQSAAADLPAPLPAQPLPGLSGSPDRVYILGSGEPAVIVAFSPLAAMAAAAPACNNHNQSTVIGAATAAAAGTRAAGSQLECTGHSRLLLKLALAAWVLACAALGIRL